MMKNKLRLIALILAVILSTNISQAQSIHFTFTDGTTASYNISEVQTLTFTGSSLYLNKNDGTSISWNTNFIRHYRFEELLVGSIESQLPKNEMLIFPNPTSGTVNIQFNVVPNENVKIEIVSIEGKLIEAWYPDNKTEGLQTIQWHAKDKNPQGIYLCRLISPKGVITKKIILQ